jgi:predicted amino acid dehydrogenase
MRHIADGIKVAVLDVGIDGLRRAVPTRNAQWTRVGDEASMNVLTIVGAGTGVSEAVARRFAREGFAIAMIARGSAATASLKKQFQPAGLQGLQHSGERL